MLLTLLSGCPWPRENPADPWRCDPACEAGSVCIDGECRPKDAAASDLDQGSADQPGLIDLDGPDRGTLDEGAWPDGLVCDPLVVGNSCTSDSGCGGGHRCILMTATSKTKICTCPCTMDDLKTTVSEDTCPSSGASPFKTACGKVTLPSGTTETLCLRTCTPKLETVPECASGIACDPLAGGSVGLGHLAWGQSPVSVCLNQACALDSDCPVTEGTPCTTKLGNCATGLTCQPLAATSTNGVCAGAGSCEKKSGLCTKRTSLFNKTAVVGQLCKGDDDCNDTMVCLMEFDESIYLQEAGGSCKTSSECCTGSCVGGKCLGTRPCITRFRNGYCTIQGCAFGTTLSDRKCPQYSTCNRLFPGGLCQKTCTASTSVSACRGKSLDKWGDYECRAWNNIPIYNGLVKAADGPVCDFGHTLFCDRFSTDAIFGPSSILTCASVGLQTPKPADGGPDSGAKDGGQTDLGSTSAQKMVCWDLKNKKPLSDKDPAGLCLDDTPAGSAP